MIRRAELSLRAVVFVLIGWAHRYDGTEAITGNHAYLRDHPEDNSEAQAFVRHRDGYYYCGAGSGELHEKRADIVLVARDDQHDAYKVVGIYRQAEVTESGVWTTIRTRTATLFPVNKRPVIHRWPSGQGMRRWAHRVSSKGRTHAALLSFYRAIRLPAGNSRTDSVDPDPELSVFEGKQRRLFILHRNREAKLRATKIHQALREGKGCLRCQVPGCGFDFFRTYGEIGHRFAIVHHTAPLAAATASGSRRSLSDLAVVCANCHAMIHRGGACRPFRSLIPGGRSR